MGFFNKAKNYLASLAGMFSFLGRWKTPANPEAKRNRRGTFYPTTEARRVNKIDSRKSASFITPKHDPKDKGVINKLVRNSKCSCGSGCKYKKCCQPKQDPLAYS